MIGVIVTLQAPPLTIARPRSLYERRPTLYEPQQWARDYLGLRDLDPTAEAALVAMLALHAAEAAHAGELFTSACRWLYDHRILIRSAPVTHAPTAILHLDAPPSEHRPCHPRRAFCHHVVVCRHGGVVQCAQTACRRAQKCEIGGMCQRRRKTRLAGRVEHQGHVLHENVYRRSDAVELTGNHARAAIAANRKAAARRRRTPRTKPDAVLRTSFQKKVRADRHHLPASGSRYLRITVPHDHSVRLPKLIENRRVLQRRGVLCDGLAHRH